MFFVKSGKAVVKTAWLPLHELAVWIQLDWNDHALVSNLPLSILSLCVYVCERGHVWQVLWPLNLPAFLFLRGVFFSLSHRSATPASFRPTESGHLALWASWPPALQAPPLAEHLYLQVSSETGAHLPAPTAKPAGITCVKTRVQGIKTEGNRAIYKLLADCLKKGRGSCKM